MKRRPDNHINSATTNLQARDSKFNYVDAHIKKDSIHDTYQQWPLLWLLPSPSHL